MKSIDQLQDLKGMTVLLRTDFDVPVVNGSIAEPFRITRQKATVEYLVSRGAKVVLAAHISAVPSFEPLKPQLEQLLGVTFGDAVTLVENTRLNPGEEKNDTSFAHELVAGCDIYVNNAFAVCHRPHASVVAVAGLLPSYAGLLIKEETDALSKFIDAPAKGKVVYMGGAKASTKAPVVRHMIAKAEFVAVGGILANDIYKVLGRDIAQSQVDDNAAELLEGLDLHDPRLVIPTDAITENGQMLDIGPHTAAAFSALAAAASMIVWNGPMGRFEDARFMTGTEAIAHAIIASGALSIVGGGDTIRAVDSLGLLEKFTFVSTGGGAMLAFLAGEQLPGLKALGYYDHDESKTP